MPVKYRLYPLDVTESSLGFNLGIHIIRWSFKKLHSAKVGEWALHGGDWEGGSRKAPTSDKWQWSELRSSGVSKGTDRRDVSDGINRTYDSLDIKRWREWQQGWHLRDLTRWQSRGGAETESKNKENERIWGVEKGEDDELVWKCQELNTPECKVSFFFQKYSSGKM